MKTFASYSLVAVALCAGSARAEVADSAAGGFSIKTTMNIQAAPDAVYRAIVQHVGDWWQSEHTFSGDAHNLSIEEKAMGCFCEKLPNSGMVRHMEVISLMPGKSIGLTGALGPLQFVGATGNMRFQLTPAEGGSKLEFAYVVTGYSAGGMNTWAAPVDGVMKEQLTRLKNYIEHGNPAPPK
jgi:uncharacterized protein YndB with AHSA1/START domain